MLVSLSVKNFAIIDNIKIDFSEGMNVLTGETGTGKSLIIDAIGLLFGNRASSNMVRFGEDKATIEGVFANLSNEAYLSLQENDIDFDINDVIIIKREIFSNGKSLSRINGASVTLSQLLDVTNYIGDIHSQFDAVSLLNPKNYLHFLKTPEIEKEISIYQKEFTEYRQNLNAYNELLKKEQDAKEKENFLKFQINEFMKYNLSVEEENNLKEESKFLSNYENIFENINEINLLAFENGTLDNLYLAISYLQKLEKIDDRYRVLRENLEENYYNLNDLFNNPLLKNKSYQFDENRLEEVNSRLGIYSDMKRKYKKDTEALITYFDNIKKELELIENYSYYLQKAKEKLDFSYNKTLEIAKNIRNKRIDFSHEIIEKVTKHLVDLQLQDTKFLISFNTLDKIVFHTDGIDEVDFLVSFNKGESLKPLSKVASGGELSRFVLALKTALSANEKQKMRIFDEIDNGVSGRIAYSIAEKIKHIANDSQVICITHLPQVASIADTHYKILKNVKDNRTYTEIIKLDFDNRIIEIAGMISKGNPTAASLSLAKELLSTTTNF